MLTSNLLAYAGMILSGLSFAIGTRLKLGPVWKALLAGAALWIVAIVLKFSWAVPTNFTIASTLIGTLGLWPGAILFWLYVGLLTGIFECGLIWLAVRFIPPLQRLNSDRALALGFGFGAFEAVALGVGALIPTLIFIYAPATLPAAVAGHIKPMDWSVAAAPVIERSTVILVHAYTTYLIVYAVRFHRPGYFWLAFAFKSAIDAVAAWASLGYKLETASHIWTLEAIVAAFAAFSVWGILAMRKRWATDADPGPQV